MALQKGSAAIDGGDDAICGAPPVNNLDQRGFVRPGTGSIHCSIGAYEFYPPPPPLPPIPPDGDRDGVPDSIDNCPFDANPDQRDTDGDGVGDVCDNCPNDFNAFQSDVCGGSAAHAAGRSVSTALTLKRVRLSAAPNGTIRMTGDLDTTDYGGVYGFVQALRTRLPAEPTTASTLFRQGTVFAFNVSGAGLAAPGQSMLFPACVSVVGCSGTNGEVANFVRRGQTNVFRVSLKAQGKQFQAPLSGTSAQVTFSLGPFDQRDNTSSCRVGGRHGGVATCRR